MILVIDIFLFAMLAYVALGVVFSGYFYLGGAKRIDEGTQGTPWHFKAIIYPGVVLFWLPLFVKIFRKQ